MYALRTHASNYRNADAAAPGDQLSRVAIYQRDSYATHERFVSRCRQWRDRRCVSLRPDRSPAIFESRGNQDAGANPGIAKSRPGCRITAHLSDRSIEGHRSDPEDGDRRGKNREQEREREREREKGEEGRAREGGNETCVRTCTRGPSLADLGATPTV